MAKVAVVTDSTANIPADVLKNHPICVAPLQVVWGDETYRDGIDIQPRQFFERLQTTKTMPTTSQTSPAAFAEIYRPLVEEGYHILSMHISSKLSGTYDSAMQARELFPGSRIEVVDTKTTAMAMGFQVLSAARAAAQGATLQECCKIVEEAQKNSGVLFVVSTLEFLRRGGRIGGAAAFLGTALNLKPILEIRDGRIEAIERVRTMNKAIDRLLELFVDRVGNRRPVHIASLHGNVPEAARQLLERAQQCFDKSEISEAFLADVSPVLGTHVGPGCMGIAYMFEA
ncbi:MAG: DegV family protein [Chloroflexi bacterium]|nr:DegV family protein [Chloroflexota bacterium]